MKVLHICSMAGIAELLSKELGDQDLVLQIKALDSFGFGLHYGNTIYFDDYEALIEHARLLQSRFDKIVIHDFVEFLGEFPKHKTYIYFHGSKLRSLGISNWLDKVNGVFLSTPDLIKYTGGKILPQPIDMELFYDKKLTRPKDWFTYNRGYQGDILQENILKDYPECEIVDRSKHHIAYRAMPVLLNEITNYVDMKFDYGNPPIPVRSISCTGLQAMACGCNVYTHDKKLLSKTLLKDHDARIVAEEFKRCLEL